MSTVTRADGRTTALGWTKSPDSLANEVPATDTPISSEGEYTSFISQLQNLMPTAATAANPAHQPYADRSTTPMPSPLLSTGQAIAKSGSIAGKGPVSKRRR